MTPNAGTTSAARSRAELIDEFLDLQPRMHRRLVRVTLSPRGRDLLRRREAAWREGVGKSLEGLTDDECTTLLRLLERAVGPPP